MLDLARLVAAKIVALRDGEEGQALVEYALILALVSIASIAALTLLGGNISAILDDVANTL
jgi:pilus assembly protein Flp/PilA